MFAAICKASNSRLEILNFHAAILVLIFIDLTACLCGLSNTLYDSAVPYSADPSLHIMDTLATNKTYFTQVRMTLFWMSASCRLLYMLEMSIRIFFDWSIILNPLKALDFLVIVVALPLRFTLNARNNYVANFVISLRLLSLGSCALLELYRLASKNALLVEKELEKELKKVQKEGEVMKKELAVLRG